MNDDELSKVLRPHLICKHVPTSSTKDLGTEERIYIESKINNNLIYDMMC